MPTQPSEGEVLFSQGKLAEAEAWFLDALRRTPTDPEMMNNLGVIYEQRGEADRAEAAFLKALDMQPGYLTPHRNLADLYEKSKRWDQVVHHLEQCVVMAPADARTLNRLGVACLEVGDIPKAREALALSLQADPAQPTVRESLAKLPTAAPAARAAPAVSARPAPRPVPAAPGRMKVVILAGGRGTRLAEQTELIPKPMVEIGGRPILWHIMKHYGHYGFNEFIIALGYKGELIKNYFLNYHNLEGGLTVTLGGNTIVKHDRPAENWTVHLVDTGQETLTGGRIKRVAPWIGQDPFLLTYGDGVASVDVAKLVAFHQAHGKRATMTAVRPPARYGQIGLSGDTVTDFSEKPQAREVWINGGFFVLQNEVLDYITGDATTFERDPIEMLVHEGQLQAFRHRGFWQCMDTVRDLYLLRSLWDSGNAAWKVW